MNPLYKPVLSLVAFAAGITLQAQTVTFNYTGSVQTFTVPGCVTSITVDVRGGKGGDNNSYLGGLGGRVQATVPVTPGEVLNIYVGAAGVNTSTNNPPVYNGGGGVYSYVSAGTAGTGGGASDIRRSPYSTSDRLVVAGGGGGGGYTNIGGHGGGLTGQDGVPYPSWPNSGGKGGTQASGGAAGVACCSCPTYTTAGTFAQGGNGAGDGAGGGGGGGGYYGGGGSCFAGGGGGSSYTAPGVTGVTHTQGNNNGAGQVIITYTSSGSAPASPSQITGLAPLCSGSTTSFTTTTVGGATSYTWTVPSGSSITSGQGTTSIIVLLGSTSGNVTVTADNSCGSSPPTILTANITITPTVSIIATSSSICMGNNTTLTANGANSYVWMPGNLTGSAITVSPSATTTYTVTGTSNGCSGSATETVSVNGLPVVALGADITLCSGNSATLDAGNPGETYLWSTAATSQTITVNTSGTYSVQVTDGNGCTGQDTIGVTFNALPVVALGNDIEQCAGSVTLDAGNAGSSFQWSDSTTAQTLTTSNSGTYSVQVTDGNGCVNADTILVTIHALPVVLAGAVPPNVCVDDVSITLTGSPMGGTWSGPGITGNTFDPSTAGSGFHALIYTYTDGNGCTNSDTVTIQVNLCLGGIVANTSTSVSVFPNPVNDAFTLNVKGASADMQISICDMEGRVVYTANEKATRTGFTRTISTNGIAAGMYYLRLQSAGEQRVEKITIQK